MKKQFKLDEIDCANCARELQDELAKLEGVKSVSVNFMTQKLTLEADDAEFASLVGNQMKLIDGRVPLYPGIGASATGMHSSALAVM